MTTYWLEASVVGDGEAAEALAETLRPFAYNDGVVIEQLGVAQGADPEALEPEVTVKVYVPGGDDSPELRRRIEEAVYYLGRLYPIAAPRFRKLEDKDWAHAWKEHYHPFRVGRRLWIQPSWSPTEKSLGADDIVISLDPGMAFGTGLHPTTQLCLRALENLVAGGERVLDVGTGSGILAIAAIKLGAAEVLALDTDPVAAAAAAENAARNGVASKVHVATASLDAVNARPCQFVVVNILAPVIVDLLRTKRLLDHVEPGGFVILSGIIEEQSAAVAEALAEKGALVTERQQIRDWVCLVAGK